MKKTIIVLSGIIVILLVTIIFLLNDRTKTIEGNILVVGSDYLLVSTDDNIDI